MRYTRVSERNGKTIWTFVPPRDVLEAGVCEKTVFTDGRAARYEIPRLIERVELYRKGEIREGGLSDRSLFVHLRNHYFNSKQFLKLTNSTQTAIERTLKNICAQEIRGKPFGQHPVKSIDMKFCRELYSEFLKSGSISRANTWTQVCSRLLDYAISIELMTVNPMSYIDKEKHESVIKVWTQGQVEAFLDEGYKEFDTRNLTLMAHMCYEWAQRPIDIANLTWSSFDWDDKTVSITNPTSGTVVYIPLEEPLLSLLSEQYEDWGFQDYVVPHVVPSGTVYKPMNTWQWSGAFRKLRNKAGLPSDLKLSGMRSTAIMEMVDAGVDALSIKQVSGHKTLYGLKPYVNNTKRGAMRALTQRRKNNE